MTVCDKWCRTINADKWCSHINVTLWALIMFYSYTGEN